MFSAWTCLKRSLKKIIILWKELMAFDYNEYDFLYLFNFSKYKHSYCSAVDE